ncbi:MAG: PQQ-binding-like beta-propeller repeat protein [bacterium]|nr:PQQ-binding-like beta-propeller repeat protein [bacterium]
MKTPVEATEGRSASRCSRRGRHFHAGALAAAGILLLVPAAGLAVNLVNESFDDDFPPPGWTIEGTPEQSPAQAHSGVYSVKFDAGTDILVTPLLTDPETLTYWMYASAGPTSFAVQYADSPAGPWTHLPGSPTETDYEGTFKQETFDLRGHKNIHVRFFRAGGSRHYYLDDVLVTKVPAPPWRMFRYSPRRTGKHPELLGPARPILKWSYQGEASFYSSPAVSATGTVYIGSNDFRLYSMGPTGSLLWSYETGDSIRSSPAIATDVVYVGSNDDRVYALWQDGSLFWSYETFSSVVSAPAVTEAGAVYIGGADNVIYSFDPAGALAWSYRTLATIYQGPSLSEESLYLGSGSLLYKLGQDGSLIWTYDIPFGSSRTAPALNATDTVYVGSSDNNLYSIDSAGALLWSYDFGVMVNYSPAISTDTVYVNPPGTNNLYAFWQDGSLYWSYVINMGLAHLAATTLDASDTVYVETDLAKISAITASGTFLWSYRVQPTTDIAIGTDTVYFGSSDNRVYAIHGMAGTPTPTPVPITQFHVSETTGSDETGNGSKAKPWRTIGKALDEVAGTAAVPVSINVAGGTYAEHELQLEPFVTLFGGFDPATWARDTAQFPSVVDGGGMTSPDEAIFRGADNALLAGFTIQNAIGAGVDCGATTTSVRASRITDCLYGVRTRGQSVLRNSILYGNVTGVLGEPNPGFTALVQNCLFLNHGYIEGTMVHGEAIASLSCTMVIMNCTIDANVDGIDIEGVEGQAAPSVLIQNNSITNNAPMDAIEVKGGANPALVTLRYNNIWGNGTDYQEPLVPGEGDTRANPLYVSPLETASLARGGYPPAYGEADGAETRAEALATGAARALPAFDYHLQEASPLIDRGSNANAPADDLDFNPRPVNGVTDIGCYEYQGFKPPAPAPPLDVIILKDTFQPGDLFEIFVQFWDTNLDWDGYIVLSNGRRFWSVLGGNRLVPGIRPIVRNALERHYYFSAKVFSMRVPFGVEGNWVVYGAILPTGWAPTLENARNQFSQLDIEPFRVVRRTAAAPGPSQRASLIRRIFGIFGSII